MTALLMLALIQEDAESLLKRFAAIDWDARASLPRRDIDTDEAYKDRLEIEHALVALGQKALPALRAALEDDNAHVRALAAYALGVLGEEEAALRERLKLDADEVVRNYAAMGLAMMGVKGIDVKRERSEYVRYTAATAADYTPDAAKATRKAYAETFSRDSLGAARVGEPAPDFTLGKFTLSKAVKKRPVVLMFQLADW